MNRIASVVMYNYNKVRNLCVSICFSVYLYLFFCSIFSRRRRLHGQTSRQTLKNFMILE